MPKSRYKIMAEYMPKVGSYGLDMMYRTCTVQTNHDFSSEADMVKKMRVALSLRERPLTGLSVAMIGELDRGRTARSLAYLLAKFDRVKIFFVAPQELQMKPDILEYLDERGVRYELESDVEAVIGEADVIYQTRIRPERVSDTHGVKRYGIDSALLAKMKSDALILHPLPRTVELDKSVDQDPRALYFRQAANGLYVRMALLTMLLDQNS